MTIIGYTHVAMELWGVIFCLLAAFCIYMSKNKLKSGRKELVLLQLSDALLLLFDAFAWIFRGRSGEISSFIVHISNFCVFIMSYTMLTVFTEYISVSIGQDTRGKRVWKRGIWILTAISIFLVILSQFNHMYYYIDEANIYHRGKWFFITQLLGMTGALINIIVIFIYRKCMDKMKMWSYLVYILSPMIAMIVQLFVYGISLLNIALTVSVLWIFVTFLIETGRKMEEQGKLLIEQAEKLVEKEREVNEMQRKIMLSQIQPHFLYNVLNTIYHLCEIEPQIARNAINDFSEYLRGNLDSLSKNSPVPFDTELKHIKVYLALEKLRFEEDLNIVYDIQERNFAIPAISVQPLVENAVKYGVGKAINGGTVSIATKRVEDHVVVTVSDDGVGFDPTEIQQDGRSHIGIKNVRQRLWLMCKATLEIQSEKGKGTVFTITVPEQ